MEPVDMDNADFRVSGVSVEMMKVACSLLDFIVGAPYGYVTHKRELFIYAKPPEGMPSVANSEDLIPIIRQWVDDMDPGVFEALASQVLPPNFPRGFRIISTSGDGGLIATVLPLWPKPKVKTGKGADPLVGSEAVHDANHA